MSEENKLFTLEEISTDHLESELNSRLKTPELGITSMPQLNSKIWGLRRSKLTIIGARTSHGKSAFTIQVAKDIAEQGFKVLFLSLEMSITDMGERLFCNMKEVSNYDLMTGQFSNYKHKYDDWVKEVKGMNFVFSECVGRTWKEIDELVANMNPGPDLVILDYIQAIKGIGSMDVETIDEYIKNFRTMAIKYNYAAVLVSQINRSSQSLKDKTPQIHQLKGSGFLEEHADVVILLYWPYNTDNNEHINKFWLDVAKQRNGPTGSVMLNYFPEYYLFKDPKKPISKAEEEKMSNEIKETKELFNGEIIQGDQSEEDW